MRSKKAAAISVKTSNGISVFHRAGRKFTSVARTLLAQELTEGDIAGLENEPNLVVEVVSAVAAEPAKKPKTATATERKTTQPK